MKLFIRILMLSVVLMPLPSIVAAGKDGLSQTLEGNKNTDSAKKKDIKEVTEEANDFKFDLGFIRKKIYDPTRAWTPSVCQEGWRSQRLKCANPKTAKQFSVRYIPLNQDLTYTEQRKIFLAKNPYNPLSACIELLVNSIEGNILMIEEFKAFARLQCIGAGVTATFEVVPEW